MDPLPLFNEGFKSIDQLLSVSARQDRAVNGAVRIMGQVRDEVGGLVGLSFLANGFLCCLLGRLWRFATCAAHFRFTCWDGYFIGSGGRFIGYDAQFTPDEVAKSFHADTYCFDSKPERECFMQYIMDSRVRKIYFTGMFTSNQGDLSIHYYDPESMRVRQYYPDFFAEMADGSYQLIEVKGDNMIDDAVVKAKAEAATIMAVESGVEYRMYRGSEIMKTHILDSQMPGLV